MKNETKEWLEIAERDLKSAEKNIDIEEHHVAAFLIQQAVEKALKALLIERKGVFPKTHDLRHLAKLAEAPENIVKLCAEINPAYTATRYPNVVGEFVTSEVKELMERAQMVIEWVKRERS